MTQLAVLAPALLGMLFVAWSGAWFFGRYAADPAGRALGWKAGAKLTSCAFLIVFTPAVALLVIGGMVQA